MSSILSRVESPADLKKLGYPELEQLAAEIRSEMIGTIYINGGHLASSLGVVELTIALHRVFDSPQDKIIWDVGHQSYSHKLLTGRRASFSTIRQYNGLSGFPVRTESPHDAFGAGHAGTSVSAALGMALARDLAGDKNHVIAVIGDGSLTAGMAFEAVNHAGHLGKRLIVVLNDNGMAISPNIGALSRVLNEVRFDPRYEFAKREAKRAVSHFPFGETAWAMSKRIKRRVEMALLPGSFWEGMGYTYLGPVDGHNIGDLESALERARDYESGPTIVHVITKKGKGDAAAEADATKFHGVSPNGSKGGPSYSHVFGQTVLRIMKENEKVVAITAAMLDGTGLTAAAAAFPDRVFDVGICEQHAVTMAAGLATQGFIPIVAIYSTFLQRAYDQIVHDVCIQNLPVVFAIDRAGIVGDDGKTHQGSFDISYLCSIPNMIVSAPADAEEMRHLLYTATRAEQPMAVRYPRSSVERIPKEDKLKQVPIGKAEVVRDGDDVVLLALGTMVNPALEAASMLTKEGIDCAVVNARFAKPLDSELIRRLAAKTGRLMTIEENALAGGFGSAVTQLLAHSNLKGLNLHCAGLPDEFVEHGTQRLLKAKYGLDAEGLARRVLDTFSELRVGESAKRHEGVHH